LLVGFDRQIGKMVVVGRIDARNVLLRISRRLACSNFWFLKACTPLLRWSRAWSLLQPVVESITTTAANTTMILCVVFIFIAL
jgi:hypothetical protein